MKKKTLIWRVLFLYGILFSGCVAILAWNVHTHQDVTVIESREEAQRRADISIPVRIEFRDEYLGSGVIEQEESLQRFDELRQKLLRRTASHDLAAERQMSRMTGHIVYLNGKIQEFELGRHLWLDGTAYGDETGDVQNLIRVMLTSLTTPQHVASLLASASDVRLLDDRGERSVSENERQQLAEELRQTEPLSADEVQRELEVRQMKPSAHLRIDLHAPLQPGAYQTNDVINLDLYENGCLALQYLGDANGRSLWSAESVCRAWLGRN